MRTVHALVCTFVLAALVQTALFFGGCRGGSPPIYPSADATDGAVSSTCQKACAVELALGCVELDDCAAVLARDEALRAVRTPCGQASCPPMTCAGVAAATSVGQVLAAGGSCGPWATDQ